MSANVFIAPGAMWNQLDAIRWPAGSKQVTAVPSTHSPEWKTVLQFGIPSLYLMYVLKREVKTIISDIRNIHIATFLMSMFWNGVPVDLGSKTSPCIPKLMSCLHHTSRLNEITPSPTKTSGTLPQPWNSPHSYAAPRENRKIATPMLSMNGDHEL